MKTPARERVDGPAGVIEVLVDLPEGAPLGLALVAHPHPLFGGTADNKVAQTLARAFAGLGCVALRPNFRGVGGSEGAHDHGDGETDDLLAVLGWGERRWGRLPLWLAGFSFGGFVQSRVARRTEARRLVLVAPAVSRFAVEPVAPGTLVIHGEQDDVVPLADLLDWARPQELPVVVVPGADHFFHRRLHLIRELVEGACRS